VPEEVPVVAESRAIPVGRVLANYFGKIDIESLKQIF
jgi:hypothetical protein